MHVFYFNLFKNVIYSCDGKVRQLLLRSSVSEIVLICWFGAQETFLIIIIVENSCAA